MEKKIVFLSSKRFSSCGLNSGMLTRGQLVNRGYQMKLSIQISIAVKDSNCLNNVNRHKNHKEACD